MTGFTPTKQTPVRWSAHTPGVPARMTRLRFMSTPADVAAPGAPAAPPPAPAEPPVTPAPQPETPPAPAAERVEDLPEWAQRIIRDTRAEAASHRTKATEATTAQQATLDKIAVALGLKQDDDPTPDPEQVTKQVTDAQAAAKTAQIELAVYKAAAAHQGDPAALLDSRAFLAKVADLDPAAADFQTKVDAAIKEAVASNAKLKANAQAAGPSSVDHAGGSGEGAAKPTNLEDAIVASMTR